MNLADEETGFERLNNLPEITVVVAEPNSRPAHSNSWFLSACDL